MKSDQQLTQDLQAELKWDSAVQADKVQVLVHGGIVTLSGKVASLAELWHVQCAVHRVYGVQSLDNQLVRCPLIISAAPQLKRCGIWLV